VETRCNGPVPGWNRTRNRTGNLDPLLTLVLSGRSSLLTTLHIGALEERLRCNSFSLLPHASDSLTANRSCLESQISGAGVSPDYLISAHCGVVFCAPSMDLACRLSGSWRLSHSPTSSGSHQSSLLYCVTAWTQATWTALSHSRSMLNVVVRVRSLASAALAFFMHRLCCSLNVRSASIQTPSQHVTCVFNCMNPLPTLIIAVSLGWRCFVWPVQHMKSATSILAVSNRSPRLLAHWMLFVVCSVSNGSW